MIINGIVVNTEEELQAAIVDMDEVSKTSLYNLFHNIQTNPTAIDQVKKIISDAMTFGNDLIRDFAAENVLMGITQDGMTGTVRRNLASVVSCLTTGSLYDAIHEIKAIPPEDKDSKYMSNARLTIFMNKIEDYLGVPRTEVV